MGLTDTDLVVYASFVRSHKRHGKRGSERLRTLPSFKKVSIICPVKNNDGVCLLERIAAIRVEIAKLAGGASQYNQEGSWFDPATGKEYTDKAVVLWTLCNDASFEAIAQCFQGWCLTLEQIELLTIVEDVQASFVNGRLQNTEAA
jgi:hypothetical protein